MGVAEVSMTLLVDSEIHFTEPLHSIGGGTGKEDGGGGWVGQGGGFDLLCHFCLVLFRYEKTGRKQTVRPAHLRPALKNSRRPPDVKTAINSPAPI